MGLNLQQTGGGSVPTWDQVGSALGNASFVNSVFTTTFNHTAAVAWLWANTTIATGLTTNASPLLELASNYWTGAASAQDLWTLGSTLAAGTNGANTLTLAHTGSTGTSIFATSSFIATSNLFEAIGIEFYTQGSSAITRNVAAGRFLSLANNVGAGIRGWSQSSDVGFCWTSVAASNGADAANGANVDTALRRLSAGTVAIGNGVASDVSGGLTLTTVTQQSANAAQWIKGQASELLTLSTVGLTTDTTGLLLPANSIIEAVVCRVTNTITTTTNWAVGDATIAARFSAANATLIAGTTSVGIQQCDQTGTSGPKQVAAAKVRITCTGSNPGAGIVRITVFYRQFVAPTS